MDKRLTIFSRYLDRTGMDHKQYQRDGVEWCLNNELRDDPPCGVRGGFLADEMGLGKTIVMIGVMVANILPRTLIVLPPVLIDQWFMQIFKTTGLKPLIYHGASKQKITVQQLESSRIVISSYSGISLSSEQMKSGFLTPLHEVSWSRVVFDEAHHLRNRKTTRFIGARMLRAGIRWLVSGTPVQNSKKDFYSLCCVLKLPISFYTDQENLPLLAKSFVIKRTKKQVGIQIPDVVVHNNIVEWTDRAEMEVSEEIHSALNFSRVARAKGDKPFVGGIDGGILSLFMRARQSCILPGLMNSCLLALSNKPETYNHYKGALGNTSKLDFVVKVILGQKGNGNGKLVFCSYRGEIDEISKRLVEGGMSRVVTFDGRTTKSERQQILNDDNEVLILQIQTGCEGLNLQEHYSEVYFVSPHWNPAVEDQAIARCHRIGQTKKVTVNRFEMGNFLSDESAGELEEECGETLSIEKHVNNVQDFKRKLASECI